MSPNFDNSMEIHLIDTAAITTHYLTSHRWINLKAKAMSPISCHSPNAAPHQKPLMPKVESSLPKSSPCNSRSASLDRVKKTNYLYWRADRARSASVGGDTLIPDTEAEEVDELWKCIRKEKALSMSSEHSRLPVRKASQRLVNKKKAQQVEDGTPSETLSTKN